MLLVEVVKAHHAHDRLLTAPDKPVVSNMTMFTNLFKRYVITNGLYKKDGKLYFQAGGHYYYSGLRATFKKSLHFIPNKGSALDIGAGFGNETKSLLSRGFDVTAVDNNSIAVRYLRKLQKRYESLTVLEEAMPTISAKGRFDVIVCEMVLHFLSEEDARTSFRKIQEHTKLGGLNVVSVYIDSPSIHNDARMDGYFSHLFKTHEIKDMYKEWDMLYVEVKKNKMGHESLRFVARK
jgi:2-polyprenyl-3-methyl-5-hydroxy-6-metoxy-1,4-benzoquinol methylase